MTVTAQSDETQKDLFPRADDTSRHILVAAIDCIRQFGSFKMSMADVAKASGYSRATVYKHFGSRQELVDAVIEEGKASFFSDLEAAARKKKTLAEQMAAAVARLMKFVHDDANSPWSGLLDPLDEALITREHGAELIATLEEFATRLVNEATERGEVRDDVNPRRLGEWYGRLLFSAHLTPAAPKDIRNAQAMMRDLQAATAPL